MQHRLMGQPIIPPPTALPNPYNLAAMQNGLFRPPTVAPHLGGQMLLSPRTGVPSSQSQQALLSGAGLPPPMVSSGDMSQQAAMLYTPSSMPTMMPTQADLSGYQLPLVNQVGLFNYDGSSMDPSTAGMSTGLSTQ